ncbi:protein SPO16 homolog [Eucyclogobius newberryi]|uniref:protein SPO16 homolog n=1 Tax=Eucyclogobius newberryi TaxID=166745 RepID=UPI003B5A969C
MATPHHQESVTQWKTTIIVSVSLENHEIIKVLRAQQHRIRFTDGVQAGAFIFPLSGTAFLLVDPQDPLHQDSVLVESLNTFVQVHRNCFVLLHAPFNGLKDMDTLSLIQHSFFGSNLRILPVRNNAEIIKGMLTIAKATSKPHVDNIRERMSLARAHIIENSPVWEMLRDMF